MVLAVVSACQTPSEEQPAPPPRLMEADASSNIINALELDGRFAPLLLALDRAGLSETLASDGPFTVFAPLPSGDSANQRVFNASDADSHIASGTVTLAELSNFDGFLVMLSGRTVDVLGNDQEIVVAGGSRVVQADVFVANGVIHLIDQPMRP